MKTKNEIKEDIKKCIEKVRNDGYSEIIFEKENYIFILIELSNYEKIDFFLNRKHNNCISVIKII